MKNSVWYLTAPDGRVVGASARKPHDAVRDARDNDDAKVPFSVMSRLYDAIIAAPRGVNYEAAGYVLARGEVAVHA